ncbi:MAG: PAS domain-containing protein [Euryarchaeota archaeon]|nr:PAS domain-containing protein [Euryarchaeota archaeon]
MKTLRFKIIVSTLMIGLLIILGSYLVIQDIQKGIIEGEFRDKGFLVANHLRLELTTPVLTNDLMEIRDYIKNLKNSYTDIEYIFVTDTEGIVIASTFENGFPVALQNFNKPSNVLKEFVYYSERGIIHEFDSPLSGDVGYVHVGLSEARVRKQIDESSERLVLLAISAFVLWGVFIFFTGRWLTEPVLRLSEGAKRINKGILDQKIDIISNDELGELAATFNDMSKSLDQKIKDLVTSKEQTETAQKYLETLFNSIDDGIIVLNTSHEILRVNDSMLKIMNLAEEQMLGRSCHEIIFGMPPSPHEIEECPINGMMRSNAPMRILHEARVNGRKKILEINSSMLSDRGEINIILVLRDVTQQKALEAEIIVRKEFNEEILNNVNLAIHVVDKDMKILAVNDELIKLSKGRFKKEEMIDRVLYDIYPFLKEKNIDKEYEYVRRTGEIFQSEEKTEYLGDVVYTSTSKIPVKDNTGSVVRIITVMKDVTGQKRLEEELKDSYEELRLTYLKLKEMFKVKETFLSNMSHELRTPLTSIMGYSELMLDEKISLEQKHKLEVIYRNSQRLSRLIQGLLDTAVIESKNLALNIQTLPLYEMIVQISDDMKMITGIKNIPVNIDIMRQLTVEGDRDRLMQVFSNILDNAVKFTLKGKIKISAAEDNEWVHIKFEDTGIGIPQDKLDKIFDRFYQLDSPEKPGRGGAGLGLWISKNIVEAHGGKIWAESKNRGSTLHVLLLKRRFNG